MQESFEIVSSSGNYAVTIGRDLLTGMIATNPAAIFLIDERLQSTLPPSVAKRIVVEATERRKSLEVMPEIILALRELGANRSSHLIAIGGGVIQDIATFAASIYMRGIRWTYMPTTLLGMADSCIGGKSSINVLGYKNLVGNFYPPEEVVIDVDFMRTLDAEQVIGGLFEAVKICYARGHQPFVDYLAECPSWPLEADVAQRLLTRSLRTKKWFIETDEFDQKERLLLNLGHTFGHALESATNFGVSHGVAVGIGMLIAIDYAQRRDRLSSKGHERAAQLEEHVRAMMSLVTAHGVRWPDVDLREVMRKFENDKKHRSDAYRVVLPISDGTLDLVSEPRDNMTRQHLRISYETVFASLGIVTRVETTDALG